MMDFKFQLIENGDEFNSLQAMLLEGTIIESRDIPATSELLDIFRWTEWQKNEYRYGLSINSMPWFIKPFVQPIMKASSKNVESLVKAVLICSRID